MIFVTVGSTMPFDELLQEIDRLAGEDALGEEVLCQTGHSGYEPRHCRFFRFEKGLDRHFEAASLLVVHGGTGSVLQALLLGKPFVTLANPRSDGDHQAEFLERLSEQTPFLWSRDVGELLALIERARAARPAPLALSTRSELVDDMLSLLR